MAFHYVLHRVRLLGQRFFHSFGLHCATHQIRIILVSCVVITSLFYPALALYSSSQSQSVVQSTSRILDAFFTGNTHYDLQNPWEGHRALRAHEYAYSRCAFERTLRVERIFVQSPAPNRQILLSTLHLQQHIADSLSARRIPCLTSENGTCFVLSPLAFWDNDVAALLADKNVLDTISFARNISVNGVPITPSMVLAGRSRVEHINTNLDSAMFLAVTYFFPDADCLGTTERNAWLDALRSIDSNEMEVHPGEQTPTLMALEYDETLSRTNGLTVISLFLYAAYAGFFAYVTWSMRRMSAVHSRVGLTFTALVEIAVSSVCSLSVCALANFQVTMVPWELLPIIIVFVGAENMFNLVDAVVKTPITLSVKQRIAEGLSKAGTSNTLKVVSYNATLGTIAFFASGAIRQFCVFAIVVLVAHWFLAHTLFMAVLSIDIQRLELEELLRQNTSLAPSPSSMRPPQDSVVQKRLPLSKRIVLAFNGLLKGRAAKNLSLLMLLAITGTLYYTTYPSSPSSHTLGALSRTKVAPLAEVGQNNPAWHIWKTLNPEGDPLLHLRIEPPTVVIIRPQEQTGRLAETGTRHRSRLHGPSRLVWRVVKIGVIPIAATTGLLYGVLLYLLKNAELLEAQRNRPEGDGPLSPEDTSLGQAVSFTTLPRAIPSDIELIAANRDGDIIAAVGLNNELVVWRPREDSFISVDTTDIMLRAASTSAAITAITALSIDVAGHFCAVGVGSGLIGVWSIREKSLVHLTHLYDERLPSGVVDLRFIAHADTPFASSDSVSLVAVYANNVAVKWPVSFGAHAEPLKPSRSEPVTSCSILTENRDETVCIGFALADGTAEIVSLTGGQSPVMQDCRLRAGDLDDSVVKLCGNYVDVAGQTRLVVAASTRNGTVSLWDTHTGECMALVEEACGEVNDLQVLAGPCDVCRFCGELPPENLAVAISLGHVTAFYTITIPDEARRCSCAHNVPRKTPSRETIAGRRSRSGSMASAAGTGVSRLLAVTPGANGAQEPLAFPVSGHGFHSRRVSENLSRRPSPSETLTVPLGGEDRESDHIGGSAGPAALAALSSAVFWHNLYARRVTDATFERGSWGVMGNKIVGIRRKPRSQGTGTSGAGPTMLPSDNGLTAASLDRWEVWMFDPSLSRLRSSSLLALCNPRQSRDRHAMERKVARLPFTRVHPIVGLASQAIAGFGNTVGLLVLGP